MNWLLKNFVKLILGLIAIVIIAVFVVIYLNMGGTKETEIAIPEVFIKSEIVFNKPVYYVSNTRKSTPTLQNIEKRIEANSSETNLNETVPGDTRFKVVKALNIAQYGLVSVDSGTRGVNYLILEDEKNNRSVIFDFDYPNPEKSIHPTNASVYRGGAKIGDVSLGL